MYSPLTRDFDTVKLPFFPLIICVDPDMLLDRFCETQKVLFDISNGTCRCKMKMLKK